MLINIENLHFSYGIHEIFNELNLSINEKKQIGLVGRNGTGKSTLLKLITGELDAQRQHCITIQHGGFTCEADTLGSHGYVYICIYPAASMDANPDRKA